MTKQHNNEETMYYVAYSRVSTDEQKNGISLDFQLQKIQQWVERQSGTWVCIQEFKEDCTGYEYERPQMNYIWKLAREGRINAIVVLRRNRFSRGESASIILEQHFSKCKVRLFSVDEGEFSPGTKNRIVSAVERAQSEEEGESNKRNMREKRRAYIEQGAAPSQGKARYGYKKVGKRGDTRYEINEQEADIVRLIISMYTNTYSKDDITIFLNNKGIASPNGGVWHTRSVRNIIDYADMYHGYMTVYKTPYRDDAPEPFTISVPPIIDDETYDALVYARETLKGFILPNRGEDRTLLLTGRIECMCGYKFRKHLAVRGKKAWYQYYYRCNSTKYSHLKGTCPIKYLRADDIDTKVWSFIEDLLKSPEGTIARYNQAQRENTNLFNNAAAHLEAIDVLLAELTAEKEQVFLLFRKGHITEDRLEADMLHINRQLERLAIEHSRWDKVVAENNASDVQLARLHAVAKSVKDELHTVSIGKKIDVLEKLRVKVTVAQEENDTILYVSLLGGKASRVDGSTDSTSASRYGNCTTIFVFRLIL